MLKIKSVHIKGIGPISNLNLSFNENFNIICGQNGIGKTTILDCIAQSFSTYPIVKKTSGTESGKCVLEINSDGVEKTYTSNVTSFHPNESGNNILNNLSKNSTEVILFKTHRDIVYQKINSIQTDTLKDKHEFGEETKTGSLSTDLKNWFVNRYLFSAQIGSLDENQIKNYELSKFCFTVLNPKIRFSRVVPASFDIMLESETGEIYFEYLSAGYKSCLAILLGLIREIELRFKNPSIFVKDFKGIVLIDEIDLHLHPEWQAKIYTALKDILPNAQIFCSTHSPHIIQIAEPSEIIALSYDESHNVKVNVLVNQEYGCQGWTLEEILTDVMGISETRTETYINAINGFNDGLDKENYALAKSKFDILDKMLHPENSLKKILKIQLAGLSND